jgi:ParB-like nuclease domain
MSDQIDRLTLQRAQEPMADEGGHPPLLKKTEIVPIAYLTPHHRNYQTHPDDEIEHIMESIRLHGIYRNVVITETGTILAGHGVIEAARRLGLIEIPVIRLAYASDDPRALQVLIGDNEIHHLAQVDDRALTELLRGLKDVDSLLGTGYDEMMLASLVMVTRPESEIAGMNEAAQWVGLPEYDEGENKVQIVVNFLNEEDCQEFCHLHGLEQGKTAMRGARKSYWWPPQRQDDVRSLRFVSSERGDDDE